MGKSSNTKMLLVLAVVVLGIYVLPSAVAKYAGSHTWERNDTTGVAGLRCGRCHGYIVNEINRTGLSGNVKDLHINASQNNSYVGPGSIINISATPTAGLDDVCWMCHIQEEDVSTTGTHTKVVIRACIDLDCHGDETGTTSCTVFGGTNNRSCNVTGMINTSADAHNNFYRPLTTQTSNIGNEDGGFYNESYVACLGCHTYVGLDLELRRPQTLSLSMNYTTGGWVFNSLAVNFTNTSVSTGGKPPGSVWFT